MDPARSTGQNWYAPEEVASLPLRLFMSFSLLAHLRPWRAFREREAILRTAWFEAESTLGDILNHTGPTESSRPDNIMGA